MIFEHFFLGCLAHASYLVGSDGDAVVIDPQRDVTLYRETAARHGLRIAHIVETHLHADFVSGHRELAERTGARIYLGARSGAAFPHTPVRDGDQIRFGRCALEFLETPGHTIESICAVLTDPDASPKPSAVFTGDTLFVGDVGRPDLAPDLTPQQLASLLYDSLHEKLLKLPDETVVYPAHGAGSLCGRQMSADRCSTIGREKRANYALKARSRDEFVRLLTDDLPPKPEYFRREVELNRSGARALDDLPSLRALSAAEVQRLQNEGCLVLDTRPVMEYAGAHVPGSVHIGLSGQFASWAARLLGLDTPILLVAEDRERVEESRTRLARVGIENVLGYLAEGLPEWIRAGHAVEFIPQAPVQELGEWLRDRPEEMTVLDVREPSEWLGGVISGSLRIPLHQLSARLREVPAGRVVFVHCKGGYRSSVASSLLRRAGYSETVNVTGGFDAWKSAGLPWAECASK